MSGDPRGAFCAVPIQRHVSEGAAVVPMVDQLAVEEPLEIRLAFGPRKARETRALTVTLRTPGHDFELAAGFLVAEQIISARGDLERLVTCGPESMPHRVHNVVRAELAPEVVVDLTRMERHFVTTSSCGICGKTTLAALARRYPLATANGFQVSSALICALPELLRLAQPVFERTGGLHAAALFNAQGKMMALREDIGRHNALDKLIGAQFLAGALPLQQSILLLSGRVSFELMQKAIVAGVPVVAAVGAPSSLAVEMARQFNVTLIGFLRENRFNVYSGEQRLRTATPAESAA